ncbi:methyl-CpG-binding domain protein 1a isoform X2 [Thalassophryne amazonica]|uniref:methyl-CpG-binding domain protein 1a isoform X2 n=1 Tax=Thalassophryne amazonica TaxID=390379 RepID=UPI001471A10E|nr:methyl-CpG-binding domain protein 1a isoform X2 [Thalassophryne amazonica]
MKRSLRKVKTERHELKVKKEDEDETLHPPNQPRNSPAIRENINGAVTMETMDRVKEAVKVKEETRWEQMYPQLKKCVIVVGRERLKKLEGFKLSVKNNKMSKKDEHSETKFDWMEPLEMDVDKKGRGRPRRIIYEELKTFVKKVKVSVPESHANTNSAARVLRPPVLRLHHFPNPDGTINSDILSPTESSFGHLGRNRRVFRHKKYNNGISENNSKEKVNSDHQVSNDVSQSETDHNYSLAINMQDKLGVEEHEPCSQSQDVSLLSCEQEAGDSHSCCSTETMKPSNIVFRKVRGDRWVLRRPEMKKDKGEEEEEREENDDGSVNTEQEVKRRRSARRKVRTDSDDDDEWTPRVVKKDEEEPKKTTCPKVQHKRRRAACGQCESCRRKDCGTCVYCLDKSKFGGRNTLKQRCRNRICYVMRMMKRSPCPGQSGERTERRSDVWTEEMQDQDDEGRNKTRDTHPGPANLTPEEVSRGRWGWRTDDGESEDDDWTPQFEQVSGPGEQLPDGLVPGTLQDGSLLYLSPPPSLHPLLLKPREECQATQMEAYGRYGEVGGVYADSWAMHETTGQQEEEVIAVKVAYGPSAGDGEFWEDGGMMEGSVGGIEEEVVGVEIDAYGRMWEEGYVVQEMAGGRGEEEVSAEGVTEEGEHYDVEVDVSGVSSDEETQTAESSDISDNSTKTGRGSDDVIICNDASEPSESISPNKEVVSTVKDSGRSHEPSGWRPLLSLLRALRRTVLPAHWVAVLAAGPLLQLLQCSRLSSMTDTIVHIRPDYCFHITVQDRPLPSTHTLYRTNPQRLAQLSQLVSLLLDLEEMVMCRGSWVRSLTRQLEARPATCQLLLRPDHLTCVSCLLGGEGVKRGHIKREEEEVKEVRTNVLSAPQTPSRLL